VHEGFPLVTLPGANVFYTNEDLSTPDGAIRCRQINTELELRQLYKAARYLRLIIP